MFGEKGAAAVVVSVDVFGVEPDCLVEIEDGPVVVLLADQCLTAITVAVCIIRIDFDGRAVIRDDAIVVAL